MAPMHPVVKYGIAGAVLAFLMATKRRKGAALAKGALMGGGVALLAPRLSIQLPGLPAGVPRR